MAAVPNVRYRESYVEKDRCVRNSTAVQVPGVDVMQGFTMSKTQFEHVFLQTAESMDDSQPTQTVPKAAKPPPSPRKPASKPTRGRKQPPDATGRSGPSELADRENRPSNAGPAALPALKNNNSNNEKNKGGSKKDLRPFRAAPMVGRLPQPDIKTPAEAADYADVCRKHAASLQRATPPDFDGAGEFFEKAVDSRARYGLYCSAGNADAHVEYAQNLSKRGLTPEAEYHLRTAADIYRVLGATRARKYGDVLLYLAVVIDRQGRLSEAENFYRSSLAVYRTNKLSDDNVRVAIDSLSNNLRSQGRPEEVEAVVRRHFLGALD